MGNEKLIHLNHIQYCHVPVRRGLEIFSDSTLGTVTTVWPIRRRKKIFVFLVTRLNHIINPRPKKAFGENRSQAMFSIK